MANQASVLTRLAALIAPGLKAPKTDIRDLLKGLFQERYYQRHAEDSIFCDTWQHLRARGHDVSSADIYSGGRHVRLELRGIPFGGSAMGA